MSKVFTAVLTVVLLSTPVTAQQIMVVNISTNIQSLSHRAFQTRFSVAGELPAEFPNPARSASVYFDCQQGFRFSPSTKPEDAKAFIQKYKSTGSAQPPFTGQIGAFKFTCPQGRATVTSSKLWETLTRAETPSRLAYRQQSLSESLNLDVVFSKGRGAILVKMGLETWAFQLEGGNFKVLQVLGAVSVSQGSQPQAVFLKRSMDKTVKINLNKPFTIHVTPDQGKTWQNILINFPSNTMSFWGSLNTAGGAVPAK